MTETTDYRALCAELAGWIERSTRHYIQDPDVLIRARAALAEEPAPPAEGEVAELVAWLRMYGATGRQVLDQTPWTASQLDRAAELLEQRHPAPVPVAEPVPAPPAEGEVAELVARLRRASDGASAMGWEQDSWIIARAANLLERQAAPVPAEGEVEP